MTKLKKLICIIISFLFVFCFYNVNIAYADENFIYLGGNAVGLNLQENYLTVIKTSNVITLDGIYCPALDSGIIEGDKIISIDGNNIYCLSDLEREISDGSEKIFLIERCGEKKLLNITPVKDLSGNYKLGVFLRESIDGIGTLTFIKDNKFACLGHAVYLDNNIPLKIKGGNLFDAKITGYVKGKRGNPGELCGIFNGKSIGNIILNSENGVYGKLNEDFDYSNLNKIEVGSAKMGDAYIYCTLNDNVVKKYSISIVKVDKLNNTKNLVIKVNDKELKESVGGIVQGMSGSPIVQGGKIVGAITHVFISDPLMGYGLSIENMISQINNI